MKQNLIKWSWLIFILLNSKAIFAADMSDWTKYANSLQNCTAGTFNLLDPIQMAFSQPPSTITYQIIGWNPAGKCQVSITRVVTIPGEAKPTSVVLKCAFPKEDLATLSQSAKNIASGNVTLSSDDPTAKIMMNSCE